MTRGITVVETHLPAAQLEVGAVGEGEDDRFLESRFRRT